MGPGRWQQFLKPDLDSLRQQYRVLRLAVQQFNPGGTLAGYSADEMRRAATERKFEIVGEAMVRLRELDAQMFGKISEAPAIVGFRNRLIHGYDAVDDEIVGGSFRRSCPLCFEKWKDC